MDNNQQGNNSSIDNSGASNTSSGNIKSDQPGGNNTNKTSYTSPNSGNKFGVFFSSFANSKVLNFAVLLLIAVGIPLTVYVAQKQQDVRQRAQEIIIPPGKEVKPSITPSLRSCPVGTKIGNYSYYCSDACGSGDFDQSISYNCSMSGQKCCLGTNFPSTVPSLTITPTQTILPSASPTTTVPPTETATISPTDSITPSISLSPTNSPAPSASPTTEISTTPTEAVTLPPGTTTIELALKLQGIGNLTSENSNPKTTTRNVKIEIFNSDTTVQSLVGTINSNVDYNSQTGTFKGIIPVPDVQTGDYSLKVSTSKYLKKIVGRDTNQSNQKLISGKNNPLPQTALIIGDINEDNRLTILDWQIWVACYNKTMTTPIPLEGISGNCSMTDVNDDGEVDHSIDGFNMRDYQWLFYSFQHLEGD